ncbi:minor tail protein [Rhodobacter phage RcKickapoo]|nr:minor tail protein [Rhodobacter phage RcKickapoo]
MAKLVEAKRASYGLTVRQQIHQHLVEKLGAMQDGGKPVWAKVYPCDIDGIDNLNMPCVGIDYGDEERVPLMGGCTDYQVPLIFMFRFAPQIGVDEQSLFQYYLGLLQFTILNDPAMRTLAKSIEEVGNNHSIVGVSGVYPGGALVTKLNYRTRLNNPYEKA